MSGERDLWSAPYAAMQARAPLEPLFRRSLSAPARAPLTATAGYGFVEEPATCEKTQTPSPASRQCVTDGGTEAWHAGGGHARREEPVPPRASGEDILGVRPAREALRRARRTKVPKLCSAFTEARGLEIEQRMAMPQRLHGRRLANAFDPSRVTEILQATEAVWNSEAETHADGEQNVEAGSPSHGNDGEVPVLQREHSQCVMCGESSVSLRMSPTRNDGRVYCILCGSPRG